MTKPRMILLSLLTAFFSNQAQAQFTCGSDTRCSDSISNYPCYGCESGAINIGSECPAPDSTSCGVPCTVQPNSLATYSFYLDTSATAPETAGGHTVLFAASAPCPTTPTCTLSPTSLPITLSSDGIFSIAVTTLIVQEAISIECIYGSVSSTISIAVEVVCGPSSTTFTHSAFTINQQFDLMPGQAPTFSFTPFSSNEISCPLSEITVSDALAYEQSTHFESLTTSSTQISVVAAEQYLISTRSFYIQFKAMGGKVDNIACTLTTRCISASVPLSLPDFPGQTAMIGSSPVQYLTTEPIPIVTGCTPVSWSVGSSASSSSPPPGLGPLIQSASNLIVQPTDQTLKATYSFYFWAQLPGGAESSVGPIQLEVGCQGYIDTTLAQTSFSQVPLQGTPPQLTIGIHETNIGIDGSYRIELQSFGSTVPECPPSLESYSLSTSALIPTLPLTEATLEAYAPGDTTFQITLDISTVQTYSFAIWAKDDETRWTNQQASQLIQVNVVCGPLTLEIPTAERNIERGTSALIDPSSFLSHFSCSSITFGQVNNPMIEGWGLTQGSDLAVQVNTANPITTVWQLKGITAEGQEAILPITIVVCGNEQLQVNSDDPVLIVRNSSTASGSPIEVLTLAESKGFFSVDTTPSHSYCEFKEMTVFRDSACSVISSVLMFVSGFGGGAMLHLNSPFALTDYYLCYETRGLQIAAKRLQVEVCGQESPSLKEANSTLAKELFVSDPELTVDESEYAIFFETGSNNCPVISYALAQQDATTLAYEPYDGDDFQMNSLGIISFRPSAVGTFEVLIEAATHNGDKAYLPLIVTVQAPPETDLISAIKAELNKTEVEMEMVVPPDEESDLSFEASKFTSSDSASLRVDDNGLYFTRLNEKTKVIEVNRMALEEEGLANYTFRVIAKDADSVKVTIVTLAFEAAQDEEAEKTPAISVDPRGELQVAETEDSEEKDQSSWTAKADSFGQLTVFFDRPIRPLNPARIDGSVLSLELSEGDAALASWTCSKFNSTAVVLNLAFSDFSAVSLKEATFATLILLDFTQFHISERRQLPEYASAGTSVTVELPKQHDTTNFGKAVTSTISTTSDQVMGAAAATSLLNVLMGQSLSQVWSLVNILQIVVHVPLIRDLSFPKAMEDFYSALLPLATFDILPSEWSTDLAFDFEETAELDEEEFPDFLLLDYETYSSIPNLGSIFWLISYTLCLGLVSFFCSQRWRCGCRRMNKKKAKQMKNSFISGLLTLLLESCLELFIVLYLTSVRPKASSISETIALGFSVTFGILSSIWLSHFIWRRVVRLTPDKVEQLEFQEQVQRLGPLYEGLRLSTEWTRAFNLFFVWRRVLLVLIIVLLREHVCLQVQAFICLNLAQCIYLVNSKPIADRHQQRMEVFNEVTILAMSSALPVFTSFAKSTLAANSFGLSVILVLLVNILTNSVPALFASLKMSYSRLYAKWVLIRDREKRRQDNIKKLYEAREQNRTQASPELGSKIKPTEEEGLPDIFDEDLYEEQQPPWMVKDRKKLRKAKNALTSFSAIPEEKKELEESMTDMKEINARLDETLELYERWRCGEISDFGLNPADNS